MRFLNKIRESFSRFMSGRYGADQLGMTMLWTSLAVTVFGSIFRLGILTLMADALLILMFCPCCIHLLRHLKLCFPKDAPLGVSYYPGFTSAMVPPSF